MASSKGLPAICSPIGRFSDVNPQLTDRAGTLARLKGAVKLRRPAKLSINSNPDMAIARRRVKNPEIQEYLRMPVACAFDQETNRLIICDTMRGRLQIYEKDRGYKDPQFNL